jgi:hypothetical protein
MCSCPVFRHSVFSADIPTMVAVTPAVTPPVTPAMAGGMEGDGVPNPGMQGMGTHYMGHSVFGTGMLSADNTIEGVGYVSPATAPGTGVLPSAGEVSLIM